MWQHATPAKPSKYVGSSLSVLIPILLLCLASLIGKCWSFRVNICPIRSIGGHKTELGHVRHREGDNYPGSLYAVPEGAFSVKGKTVKSPFLFELIERGLIANATDLARLDELFCSRESAAKSTDVPAVYYGIDLTANFIHEGTLLQLLLLRRFLAQGFNVVVLLGGGTTLVGDPSFKSKRTKATITSSESGNTRYNAILDRITPCASVKEDNYAGILEVVKKLLTRELETVDGHLVHPALKLASAIGDGDLTKVTSTPYNVVVVNNRDIYDRVTLTEYLGTVARNMSVGRMLSRECIKSRLLYTEEAGVTTLRMANMDLAEFIYMSLQATDFVHVASKYNAVIQLGGSDQMGNIMSGIELANGLNNLSKPLFGITTPLLQTRSGEKVSKSNSEELLRITADIPPLVFWSHFRNVDDQVVGRYLQWLTQVPINNIDEALAKHVNTAKVLLADELTSSIFGKRYTDALQEHWVKGDVANVTKPRENCSTEEYDSLVTFVDCVPHVEVSLDQLTQGVPFAELLDMLRTPQLVSGLFYSNRRAIREGTCRINGIVETHVDRLVTANDLLNVSCEDGRSMQYIALQFGKRQLYLAVLK
ncbi:Tyrosine--tRNA ligase [Babesia sp. Xinjiang]|uniref:Tyrosine--tRNA ligase n=1 Tax=Babesia sp. Xinjiang TaxID=462227 RepID=UPI000A251193|nr:Tyrosine--tRNA ligase [Babesia sp. Xinjiang]ORM39339.1 Tyrosine--tRNA ligase [Babesia sp. Xinjiang]